MTAPRRRPVPVARPRPGRWGRIAGGVALLVITGSGIGHAMINEVSEGIDRVDAFGAVGDRPRQTRGTTFLLVGTDGRDGLGAQEKQRYHLGGAPCHCTDTIMLVHLSEDRSRVSVIGIPRDTYVTLPPRRAPAASAQAVPHPAKINAAYAEGGPRLTVLTVEKATGVHIDHYLEIDFTSFMQTVDVLGGVQVCTRRPLKDSYSGLDLPAGTTTLNGGQALQYVRSRHLDGAADLGRMRRQQRFLAGLIQRVTSGGVLANPVKLGEISSTVLGSVRADPGLRPDDLIGLAEGMKGFGPGSAEFASVPLADRNHRVEGVGSTVTWDEAKAGKLWAAVHDDRSIIDPGTRSHTVAGTAPSAVHVHVDNGTRLPGLAGRADSALRAAGFTTTGTPGNASVHDARRTVIRYDPRWDRPAKSLAAALPGARLVPVAGQGGTLRVTLGADFRKVAPIAVAGGTRTGAVTGDDRSEC